MRIGILAIAISVTALATEAAFAEGAVPDDGRLAAVAAPAEGPAPAGHKAGARRPERVGPGIWWLSVGANAVHVEGSGADCLGGFQFAAAVGRTFFLRARRAFLTYDDTNACDFYWLIGNSWIIEDALSFGIVSLRSGLFVAAGPAEVNVKEWGAGPLGTDTGLRYELGWSSRHMQRTTSWLGVEVALFATKTDVRDYAGFVLNFTFGPGN